MAKKGKKIAEPVPAEPERLCGVCDQPESAHGLESSHFFQRAPFTAPTIDERVAAVFSAPEPTGEPTEAERWHAEAAEILDLVRAGNAVSPSRVIACLSRAVGLVPR